jgi:hypothetical protein
MRAISEAKFSDLTRLKISNGRVRCYSSTEIFSLPKRTFWSANSVYGQNCVLPVDESQLITPESALCNNLRFRYNAVIFVTAFPKELT